MTKKEKEKKSKEEVLTLLKDYLEYSTVAGLHFAFDQKQPRFGNLLWAISVFVLTVVFIYVSVQNYNEWKAQPVLISVATTGLPISKVPFPSVVVCSQGDNQENFYSSLYKLFIGFLWNSRGLKLDISPIRVQRYLTNTLRTVSKKKFSNFLSISFFYNKISEMKDLSKANTKPI